MVNTYVSATAAFPAFPTSIMAGAYESRATQIARLFLPIASFAGDTAQTVTDGSFNSNNASILKSSTAVLASPSNILNAGNQTNNATDPNPVTAKPLIIKVRRDPFSGEITGYGVFNADGSVPGQPRVAGTPLYVPGQNHDPFQTPGPGGTFTGTPPRYLVDRMTGQVYLNNAAGVNGVNLDSANGAEIVADAAAPNNVVGIVEFKALEGAALSTAQQKASELSNVIQSLATLIRGFKDSERNLLNTIR